MSATVVLTDYAWPDYSVERDLIERAGFKLIAGRASPVSARAIEDMVREHNPVGILTCWAEVNSRAVEVAPNLKVIA